MAQYKYSRDDYYRLTNAPCIDVALALGMEINERASDQKAWKMKDEQGLCIYREGNNWYRFSDGKHGFPIDLVIDKLGCSREQALDFIAKNVVNGVSEQVRLDHKAPAKVKKELPKEKNFTVPAHDVKPSRVMAYLIKTRGIDPEIVKGMLQRKMIAEDSAHHNCLFFGRDEKGNIRSCAQRGTTQVQFRGEVSGGDKAYTFAMNGKSNVLRLFESPIDAMSQQNVESHFKELLSERGVLPDWSGMESIITDMAEKYRDDFGYGYDEDMQGYIDDHEDEIKEITDKYLYGDIYVDKGNISDFTGRIMIVRPEHINSRDVIPENQLFLAQEGPGCNPEDYGSEINGIFLYEREEASLTNDCFLGAMREEHIPEWANEAREDIAEESSDEEADDEYEPEM